MTGPLLRHDWPGPLPIHGGRDIREMNVVEPIYGRASDGRLEILPRHRTIESSKRPIPQIVLSLLRHEWDENSSATLRVPRNRNFERFLV